jgi:hypothetical protein
MESLRVEMNAELKDANTEVGHEEEKDNDVTTQWQYCFCLSEAYPGATQHSVPNVTLILKDLAFDFKGRLLLLKFSSFLI